MGAYNTDRLYMARRTFEYDNSLHLDRGQLFNLAGHRNDEKLVRIGFVEEVVRKITPVQCGVCGQKFVDEYSLNSHGNMRHSGREPQTEHERVVRLEQIQKQDDDAAPLYLDQTVATRDPASAKRGRGRPRKYA